MAPDVTVALMTARYWPLLSTKINLIHIVRLLLLFSYRLSSIVEPSVLIPWIIPTYLSRDVHMPRTSRPL